MGKISFSIIVFPLGFVFTKQRVRLTCLLFVGNYMTKYGGISTVSLASKRFSVRRLYRRFTLKWRSYGFSQLTEILRVAIHLDTFLGTREADAFSVAIYSRDRKSFNVLSNFLDFVVIRLAREISTNLSSPISSEPRHPSNSSIVLFEK